MLNPSLVCKGGRIGGMALFTFQIAWYKWNGSKFVWLEEPKWKVNIFYYIYLLLYLLH